MAATPVLLLDDDNEVRELMAGELRGAGFDPTEAGTVAEAETMALREPVQFEALILDVMLPDGDGRDLCGRLRGAGRQMPVLMLSGTAGEGDVVRGLEAGAHDYVAKPFRPAVLIARLRAQLRLHEASVHAVPSIGPWQFHPARKLLRNAKGAKLWLTGKETELLRYLRRVDGHASKRTLLSEVWGRDPSATTHVVETTIYRLRQKIESDPCHPQLLVTTAGEGYGLAPAPKAAA